MSACALHDGRGVHAQPVCRAGEKHQVGGAVVGTEGDDGVRVPVPVEVTRRHVGVPDRAVGQPGRGGDSVAATVDGVGPAAAGGHDQDVVTASGSLEVVGRQGGAEVLAVAQRADEGDLRHRTVGAAAQHGQRALVGGTRRGLLAGGGDDQVGEAVTVQVPVRGGLPEAVTGLGGVRHARGVLRDLPLVRAVRAAAGARDDGHLVGVGHSGRQVGVAVAVDVPSVPEVLAAEARVRRADRSA